MPCVAIRWVVVVAKELRPRARHIMKRPTPVQYGRNLGQICKTANIIGRSRYIIPFEVLAGLIPS